MGEVKEVPRILEGKMLKQYDKIRVLRYFALLSTTQGGLAKPEFDALRRSFIMNYGYQEMITLMNMQDAGLIKLKDKKNDWNWEKIKNILDLLPDGECDLKAPSDFNFIFNGFSPMSVRLIERLLDHGGMQGMAQKGIFKQIGLTDDKLAYANNEHALFAT